MRTRASVAAREPGRRQQNLEMLLGILLFFTGAALVATVAGQARGEPSLGHALVLVGLAGATALAHRAWTAELEGASRGG